MESGIGLVHNTFLYDNVQKSVLRCPWEYHPSPAMWDVNNTNLEAIVPNAIRFIEHSDNLMMAQFYLMKTALAALRG